MSKKLFLYICILSTILAGGMLSSCNRDDIISGEMPPRIILENETAIYEVKVGKELTIAPKYENVNGATYTWSVDKIERCSGPVFTAVWDEAGSHYIDLTVNTSGGSITEEMRVDVLALKLPYISFPFSGDVISLKVGTDYMLTPVIANTELDGTDFSISWTIDGTVFSADTSFHFVADTPGDYVVAVKTINEDGCDQRQFTIHVVEKLPFTLEFPTQTFLGTSTRRYTFPGRPIMLCPIIKDLIPTTCEWTIDGNSTGCDTDVLVFKPDIAGEYIINLTVDSTVSASVIVECVDASEETRQRKRTPFSRRTCNKVYEWIPAPGQFIGEDVLLSTHDDAIMWAEQRLNNAQYVSLGGFGGYIVVGFDHSIEKKDTSFDFAIMANAFFNLTTGDGGSNEPGIVYVSQDVNGNGLPDDEWFELRGSETDSPTTLYNYAVTYYRPSAPRMSVSWTDCIGQTGTIDYLSAFHRQDYYYPSWIEGDSYTLRGTCLKSRTTLNTETGMWDNNCFAWGYADNMGSDVLSSNDKGGGEGQRNGFAIKNAMYMNGDAIDLKYIDFIKVQTGVNSKAGWLGEVSTEVFGFEDL